MDRLAGFAEVRIEREEVAGIFATWSNLATRSAMMELWEQFLETASALQARLGQGDWTSLTSWQLVFLLERHVAVKVGIARCCQLGEVPPAVRRALPPRDSAARYWLYLNALVSRELAKVQELHMQLPLAPPYPLAVWSIIYLGAGPLAVTEMKRRAGSSEGFHASLLHLVLQLYRRDWTKPPSFEQVVDEALKKLGPSVDQLRAQSPTRRPRRARAGYEPPSEQIPFTLLSQTAGSSLGDPWEALARALEGERPGLVKAIRRDAIDAARQAGKPRRRSEVSCPTCKQKVKMRPPGRCPSCGTEIREDVAQDARAVEAKRREATLEILSRRPATPMETILEGEEAEQRNAKRERLARDPRFKKMVKAVARAEAAGEVLPTGRVTNKVIARHCRVSPKTVARWLKALGAML